MPKWISVPLALTLALTVLPAEAARTPAQGLLLVRTTYAPLQPKEGIPIEGYLTYIRIRDAAGRVVYQRASGRLRRRFAPGRYALSSYIRTCAGTCESLDRPSDHCSRRLRLRAGRTLRVRIRRAASGRCKAIQLLTARR